MRRGMRPHHMLIGWPDKGSPMYFMRFAWIANHVNRGSEIGYELFKPWRKYDAVVFLKSMEMGCDRLLESLKASGVVCVFEANVDYYTLRGNESLPQEILPSEAQRQAAIRMTTSADKIIASSRHLAGICSAWTSRTTWVPDNIPDRWIGGQVSQRPVRGGRLQMWWSGMASKLGDLLEIEKPLRTFSDKIHLHLVTGDLPSALDRLPDGQGNRLRELLADLQVTIHRFRDVPSLLALYRSGGVIISPRQLANPYNQSHTEWKITLGMAVGLPAIVSPQPSYLDVAEIADHPKAVTICASDADWCDAFAEAMGDVDFEDRSRASLDVVQRHYSSSVVAKMHSREMLELLSK